METEAAFSRAPRPGVTPGFSVGSVAGRDHAPQGHEDPDVKRNKALNPLLPIHDYRPALQFAVSWLGQRYLLAEPVQRRPEEPRPFFAETPRWFPAGK
jgi:hypothetical protein